LRVAVASPFVDRRHGTERALAELLDRLAGNFGCEVYLYAQRVEGLNVQRSGKFDAGNAGGVDWRRVPSLPGPHLLRFVWWYWINRCYRRWDRLIRGAQFDLVFSPGINCADADVILVHAVFHRLAELQRDSPHRGYRALHRSLYYRMLCHLERRIYSNPRIALCAVSRHTADQLARYFGRGDVTVIPNGVDSESFCPAALAPLREPARAKWRFAANEKVLLLIGNDWQNKGLQTLLEAMTLCQDLPLKLLVVGSDDPVPFLARAHQLNLVDRVVFAAPSDEVRAFYAAADIFVAPSLEDSFNLPALEAMACGLPVILSLNAGMSEWVHAGEDAILLKDPQDARELADAIRSLVNDPRRASRIGQNAVRAASALTWDRHAEAVFELLSRLKKS
jgi:UDP-glucose:(heptosyl)LPS alpha-1,3-glucosyltransferase